MMRLPFRDLSITTKLTGIVTLAAGVALLLASCGFVVYDLSSYRAFAQQELTTTAQMVAGISTAALAFGDAKAAHETLANLRAHPHIEAACIYQASGARLAAYRRSAAVEPAPNSPHDLGLQFKDNRLEISYPIAIEQERVGTLYIRSDLKELDARLMRYAGIVLILLAVSLIAALIVANLLQRSISRPILHLAEAASLVSRDGDYSLRVARSDRDEIGVLFDRFNEMMAQIHSRDLALLSARDQLEDRVAERTEQLVAEVTERKSIELDLIAARDAAEASNRAKSMFLANMSHELRTPLNAIIGYSELLEETAGPDADPDTTADLRRIQSAGRHLLALINDVLDLSKIEAGRMEVRNERLTVGAIIDEAVDTARPLIQRNGNVLTVDCELRHLSMTADRVKFRQSLLNLLSNAAKFTENGAIALRVHLMQSEHRTWLDWSVTDTGIGIAPDEMSKLFKSFSQVDSSSTRRHGGTGLGLAISQKLCHMMGGFIFAESVPNCGSTFTIRMPYAGEDNVSPAGMLAALARNHESYHPAVR
ncbi:MAG: HAMP domain-containing protein [Bryobacterales bacterium]|nr:HAMP domain-containing protein [Bryobacterales bacterium]